MDETFKKLRSKRSWKAKVHNEMKMSSINLDLLSLSSRKGKKKMSLKKHLWVISKWAKQVKRL